MTHKLMTTLVARPPGEPIIIVKAPRGIFRAPWEAAGAITALRPRLPSEQLHLDVVIMAGEPTEDPKLFGSPDSSAYIRSALATIATHTWTPATIDY
jgi:hypothetical protein